MEWLTNYILENPQVGAAIITAMCGILGIFINIGINISFRKRDYNNKRKFEKIENMDIYFLPLCDKVESIIEFLDKISKDETDLLDVLTEKKGATIAKEAKRTKEYISDLNVFFEGTPYKFQEDYKLFQIHRKVKNKFIKLNKFITNRDNSIEQCPIDGLVVELEELVYRIHRCEIKLMIHCSIAKNIGLLIAFCTYTIKKWRN